MVSLVTIRVTPIITLSTKYSTVSTTDQRFNGDSRASSEVHQGDFLRIFCGEEGMDAYITVRRAQDVELAK